MFAAVLDTCVLWPSLQRDFLLSMAVEGLYRPLWSEVILDELEFHEAAKLERRGHFPAAAQAASARLVGTMREYFDDALVTGWEPLEGTFSLPVPDDEHVVATAVVGGAGVIVTDSRKDVPRDRVPGHPGDLAGRVRGRHGISVPGRRGPGGGDAVGAHGAPSDDHR
ncbi:MULTISPECIES: PIN domain-containing protein [Rhodococcus]|uniref:PIN domain-containing protein n=1 Tax=Rhodococcus jostii TaxID=132919 RepID=A0A1H5LVT3_RHOJO|nr:MULTISPECIES: PIN domain-containing protein [Rhodococcus]SEE81080.1 PIN domain-containing protein [Rhodococcus jostii]